MSTTAQLVKEKIQQSGLTIFDALPLNHELHLAIEDLEELLRHRLLGESLTGLPLRTRSKVVKNLVCESIGYPIPKSFKKTQPRFLGQNFDIYVQKSNNLQIWNEEISLSRRYVIIALNEQDIIKKIKIITGSQLALFDNTGTITKKYQARITHILGTDAELIADRDTLNLQKFVSNHKNKIFSQSPSAYPTQNYLLPIEEIFNRLKKLLGVSFVNPGASQERNRGVELQKLVCSSLGYSKYEDTGQFPDVFNQILEVKLQTSRTIELGLNLPSSDEELYTGNKTLSNLRHNDARYAVFYGKLDADFVKLTNLVVVTGEKFFTRFQRFEGKVTNEKIQLRLPKDLLGL